MNGRRAPEDLDIAPVQAGTATAPAPPAAAPAGRDTARQAVAPVPHAGSQLMQRLRVWEDLLTLLVDRDAPQVRERAARPPG